MNDFKIKIVRTYGYVVRFYDENDRKIGYVTCSGKDLVEELNKKEFIGKKVFRTDYNKI